MGEKGGGGGGSPSPPLKDVEVYGFVGWIGTFVAYGLFLFWAYVPEHILHQLGITYYPDKHWALTVPVFLVVAFFMVGIIYCAINLLSTAPLDSFHTITDSYSRGVVGAEGSSGGSMIMKMSGGAPPSLRAYDLPPGVPNIADLHIGVVNQILYHDQPPAPPHHHHARHHQRSSRGTRQQSTRREVGGGSTSGTSPVRPPLSAAS